MALELTLAASAPETNYITNVVLGYIDVAAAGIKVTSSPTAVTVQFTNTATGLTLFNDFAVARELCKIGGVYGRDETAKSLVRASRRRCAAARRAPTAVAVFVCVVRGGMRFQLTRWREDAPMRGVAAVGSATSRCCHALGDRC